jgi:uncharacterized membrane protein
MNPALHPSEQNIRAIARVEKAALSSRSLATRLSVAIATVAGSGWVIALHVVWFAIWLALNTGMTAWKPFDPYPFSLLTAIVSLEAIFLTLFVLAAQNRLARETDKRAHLDLQMVPEESRRGEIRLRLPNLTFANRLTFADDQVEFFHAPGHTICSTICHDLVDNVLFVGDLVEVPIPYVLYHDVEQFIDTLEQIKTMASSHTIITAHSGIVGVKEIDDDIAYLRALLAGDGSEEAQDRQALHHFNRNNLSILKVEQVVRAELGSSFNYETFLRRVAVALGVDPQDLRALRFRIRQIDHQELVAALDQYFA